MSNTAFSEPAGEWYLGVYCRRCRAPVPVFHNPERRAVTGGTGKLTVCCPRCRKKSQYAADEMMSFLVYADRVLTAEHAAVNDDNPIAAVPSGTDDEPVLELGPELVIEDDEDEAEEAVQADGEADDAPAAADASPDAVLELGPELILDEDEDQPEDEAVDSSDEDAVLELAPDTALDESAAEDVAEPAVEALPDTVPEDAAVPAPEPDLEPEPEPALELEGAAALDARPHADAPPLLETTPPPAADQLGAAEIAPEAAVASADAILAELAARDLPGGAAPAAEAVPAPALESRPEPSPEPELEPETDLALTTEAAVAPDTAPVADAGPVLAPATEEQLTAPEAAPEAPVHASPVDDIALEWAAIGEPHVEPAEPVAAGAAAPTAPIVSDAAAPEPVAFEPAPAAPVAREFTAAEPAAIVPAPLAGETVASVVSMPVAAPAIPASVVSAPVAPPPPAPKPAESKRVAAKPRAPKPIAPKPIAQVYRERWAEPAKRPQVIAELRPLLRGLKARAEATDYDVLVRVADLFLDYLADVAPERQSGIAIEQYIHAVFALSTRGRARGTDRIGEEMAATLRALNRHAGLYIGR